MFLDIAQTIVIAAPDIQPVTPPGADGLLRIAGWLIFLVGMGLVLAFAVGIGHLAWAHFHHRTGMSAMGLGIILFCGVLLGSLGAIMNGLF